jgi:hypothetical protein
MANAPEPDRDRPDFADAPAGDRTAGPGAEPPEDYPLIPADSETETVVINKTDPADDPEGGQPGGQRERRFTAPGFDAKETQVIVTTPEPPTEAFHSPPGGTAFPPPPVAVPPKTAVPQSFPPRTGGKPRSSRQRTWGWVLAIVVIVLALSAIAILGTVLIVRSRHAHVSQEDQVRHSIQTFDVAVQTGDLTTLRTITCGTTRDSYVEYDEHSWAETYHRVSAARQYPVIASIDQVIVNGQHAEANITTFMAYDPQVRSTRSLDLQFRDDQWKICQSPSA